MQNFWDGFFKEAKTPGQEVADKMTKLKPNNMMNSNLGKPKVSVKVPGTPAGKSLGGKHGVSSMRI